MASDKTKGMLPTETNIPFGGHSLRLVKLVGSGATSEVYEAYLDDGHDQAHVAVKAMKPLEFARARQFFLGEALTLARLHEKETETNAAVGLATDLHIAPRYFGRGQLDGVEFLVMAWIEGRQIPDLLAKSPAGRLPEQQALIAGLHLFRMLDLLHTSLRKSYIDLKFENLWWQGSPTDGQLRMTDFGTMEDIETGNDRPIRRDLLVASTYLCKMLTGHMPDHIAGELREQVVPVIQRADYLSWGARQLLSRLLHPNPDERPVTAAAVLQPGVLRPGESPASGQPDLTGLIGLQDLANYWGQTDVRLAQMKNLNWERSLVVEGAERLRMLGRARALLDIWALRNPGIETERVADERRQLEEGLQQSGALENGRALFTSRSFTQAEALFTRGRRESYEPERKALFRRWAYLAQMGVDPKISLTRDAQQDLELAIKYTTDRNWAAAERQLEDLQPALGKADAFGYLAADVALYKALAAADAARANDDYATGVKAFDDALAALQRLPRQEQADVLRDETGPLRPERERLGVLAKEKAGATEGSRLMHAARQYLDAGKGDEAWRSARHALVIETFDRDARCTELTTLVDQVLQSGDFALADALATIALDVPVAAPQLLERKRLAGALLAAQRALGAGDTAGLQAHVDVASRLAGGSAWMGTLLSQATAEATKTNDAALLRDLAGLATLAEKDRARLRDRANQIDNTWRSQADKRAAEQRERNRPLVDELLSDAGRYLYLADPRHPARRPDFSGWNTPRVLNYLKDKSQALKEARRLGEQAQFKANEAGGYRIEEAKQLVAQANTLANQLRNLGELTESARSRDTQQASEARQRLAELAARLTTPVAAADPESQLTTARDLLIGSRLYLTTIDPADSTIESWAEQAAQRVDFLRPQQWRTIRQQADERLTAFQAAFEEAEAAFQNGETRIKDVTLNAYLAPWAGTPEYQDVEARLRQAAEWQQFAAAYTDRPGAPYRPERLADLRRWLPLPLPVAFWRGAPAEKWLEATRAAAAAEAKANINLVRQPFASSGASAYATSSYPSARSYDAYPPETSNDPYGAREAPPAGSLSPRYDQTGRSGLASAAGYSPPRGPEVYLQTLKWWFDAAATRWHARQTQQTNGTTPVGNAVSDAPGTDETRSWTAASFLAAAAQAAWAGDASRLARVVEGGPFPDDIDDALRQLSPELWQQAFKGLTIGEPERRETSRSLKADWRRWWPFAAGGGVILLLLLVALLFGDNLVALLSGVVRPTPTAAVTAIATPTSALNVAPTTQPTATPSPTLTLTPTVTPSPTLTLTPVATLPPPEQSAFFVGDPTQLLPAAPVAGATLWRLLPDRAQSQPPLDSDSWQHETDPVVGDFSYIEDFSVPVSLSFVHDQPLAEGLYQLYVLDTTNRSQGAQTFEVFLDGQPVEPARGVREIRFNFSDMGQTEPAWLSIGAYEVTTGQRLSVRATVGTEHGQYFAVPSVLVARLGDREHDLLLALPEPSLGRPLVALLDDDRIVLTQANADATEYKPGSSWPSQQEAQPPAEGQPVPPVWNGRYYAATLVRGRDTALRAEWQGAGRLPAGRYQIYAYIPAGGNAVVNYDLLADGAVVNDKIVTNTEQRQFNSQWVDLGIWTLPNEASVGVRATAPHNANVNAHSDETEWIVGIDAVALLRVGD